MEYLIRDDGSVFPFDERTAKRKDMRLMSKEEAVRYMGSLKPDGKKFVPDPSAADAAELAESDIALDLTDGELYEKTPEVCSRDTVIILTVAQAEVAKRVRQAEDGEIEEGSEADEADPTKLEAMSVPELRSHAKARFNITMPNTIKKVEAIAQIKAAMANGV